MGQNLDILWMWINRDFVVLCSFLPRGARDVKSGLIDKRINVRRDQELCRGRFATKKKRRIKIYLVACADEGEWQSCRQCWHRAQRKLRALSQVGLIIWIGFLEVFLPYDPSYPSVGWLVCRNFCRSTFLVLFCLGLSFLLFNFN